MTRKRTIPGSDFRTLRLRRYLFVFIAAGLSIAGAGVSHGAEGAVITSDPARAAGPGRVTPVTVLELIPQPVRLTGTYLGTVNPRRRVTLRAETAGLVEHVAFDEGDRIARGQTLVHISTRALTAERNLARSNRNLTRSTLERDQQLFDRQLIPRSQLDLARAREREAYFTHQLRELDLRKSRVRAPMAGLALSRAVEIGEYVRKGQKLAELVDLSSVRVRVFVPERDIRFVARGQPARVEVDGVSSSPFEGRVHTIGPEADPRHRSFPVDIDVPNPRRLLRPGMLVRVVVTLQHLQGQVVAPFHAVLEGPEGPRVYVEQGGRVQRRSVLLGSQLESGVQILSGLAIGEGLVISGMRRLSAGAHVDVISRTVQRVLGGGG